MKAWKPARGAGTEGVRSLEVALDLIPGGGRLRWPEVGRFWPIASRGRNLNS